MRRCDIKGLKVKLETMLQALDYSDDMEEYGWYISLETGEMYDIWDEMVNDEYNDELYNEIVNNPERYIQLPDGRCVDHFNIMEGFVSDRVSDVKKKKKLTKTIKNIKRTHILAKFDGEINAQGLLDEWHKYQDEEYEKYARAWCAEHNITII